MSSPWFPAARYWPASHVGGPREGIRVNSFRDFEHTGWEGPNVCSGYQDRLGRVVAQSMFVTTIIELDLGADDGA
jgi:hypothetical protein